MRRIGRWTVAMMVATLAASAGAQPVRAGEAAPEIELPALDGTRFQLSALRGHPVMLSFWGTWCPPCRSEFPDLVAAHALYASSGLQIVGVNGRDQERRTSDVTRFVDEFHVPFRVALDERGRTRRRYGLLGLPTTVFIDSAGLVRRVHIGPIAHDDLVSGIAVISGSRAP